jgi:drug/metabolite transporter (DMT)-like permease
MNNKRKKINYSFNKSISDFSVISDSYFQINSNYQENYNNTKNQKNSKGQENKENFEKFESLISLKKKNPQKNIIVQNNFKSIIILFFSSFLFSITNLIGKYISMYYPEVNINTCNFIRGFFAFNLSLLYTYYYKIEIIKEFKNTSYSLLFKLIVRCTCGSTSQILLFISFKYLRISSATTIFCISPILVTIFTWILLNGKINKIDIIALIICFCSLCLITKPQFIFGGIHNENDTIIGCFFALLAAIVNSLAIFTSKLISCDFNLIIQPLVLGIFYMLECFILLCFEETGLESFTFFLVFLTIFFSTLFWINLLLFVYGLSLGDPIKVISIQYSGIVFTLFYNIFIFKQGFDILDLLGSFSIIGIMDLLV